MIDRFLSCVLLSVVVMSSAWAINIDITNHPDKEFIRGYEVEYFDGCHLSVEKTPQNTEHIISKGECPNTTKEIVMRDMTLDMEYIKKLKKYDNFYSYFKENKSHDDPYNRLPMEYWEYMDGYKYQYSDGCSVAWHIRTSSFLIPRSCPDMSNEMLKDDAIKSIKYAKSKSNAENFYQYYNQLDEKEKQNKLTQNYTISQSHEDARKLWYETCVNKKSLNFVPFAEMADRYPGIHKIHAARLYRHANTMIEMMGGMVDCSSDARHAVELYTKDIDIRAKQ